MSQSEQWHVTGTLVNYYFHCRRQLWFFSHQITLEQESDMVYQGKIIHETSYDREKKEIEIDQVKIDFFDLRNKVLHEVKKSPSFQEGHVWQVYYYLYFLKQKGISDITGEIDYPKLRRTEKLVLTAEKEVQMETILADIDKIIKQPAPPSITHRPEVCKECSYYELCMI
jgi:CRISPR-associated exonuclease Cas4